MRCNDTYKEIKTFTYNNCIARVHIPDITPDERARRMDEIKKAAGRLLAIQERG